MTKESVGTTTVRTITVQVLHDRLMNGKIVLPRFQRASVWPKNNKRELMNSIRKRLPIGSLLVYQSADPAEQGRQVLVDGLQRTLAIREYMQNPQAFITAESLRGHYTSSVVDAVTEVAEENGLASPDEKSVFECIETWVKQAPTLSVAHLTADKLANLLDESLDLSASAPQKESIREPIYALADHVISDHKIDDYPIALIEYSGSATLLPEIFRNINSGGVPLDDFDQFATDWIDFMSEVSAEDVKAEINHKWNVAVNKNLIVERWGAGGPTDGYTFWEYLFGLGRVLKKDHPWLFGGFTNDPDGTNTERISFYLAALIHGLVPRVGEIRRLPFLISSYAEGGRQLDLARFETALRKSCKELEQWLRPSVGMKLNSALASDARIDNLSQLSQFLVLAMVARTVVGRWVPYSWEERSNWRGDWDALKTELPRHLLFEVLQGSWRGSGDSNAFASTWEGEQLRGMSVPPGFEPATALQPTDLFVRHRDRTEWQQMLDIWLRSEVSGAQRVNRSVSKEAKLVLRYVYSDMPLKWHSGNDFQIDHLLPVSRLAGIIERDGGMGWPISAIGNLALLPARINEAKGDRTCTEYLSHLPEPEAEKALPFVQYGAFFPLEDLSIRQEHGEDAMTREEFIEIVSRRQTLVRDKVLEALGLSPGQSSAVVPL